jgi:hypothetical protein
MPMFLVLTAVLAATPPQTTPTVQPARWLNPPSSDAAADFMPGFANMLAVDGYVTLTCEVEHVGPPENCAVARESPTGLGFGEAALKIAQLGVLRPRLVDGKAVRAEISFSLPFMAYPLVLDPPRPYTGPAPSEAALTFARDLVRRDLLQIKKLNDAGMYDGLSPERIEVVRPWIDELFHVPDERIVNDLGLAMARVMTMGELASYQTDGVPALLRMQSMEDLMEAASSDLFTVKEGLALRELRRRYCTAFECKGDGSGQTR